MKKDILISAMVIFIGFIGLTWSLMQIYASPDQNSYPFNGSIIYLGTSVFMFIFLLTQSLDISKSMKWINIIIVFFYAVIALLLSLICLYAPPIEGQIYPLASAIFTVSSMILFSSLFLIGRCHIRTKSIVENR